MEAHNSTSLLLNVIHGLIPHVIPLSCTFCPYYTNATTILYFKICSSFKLKFPIQLMALNRVLKDLSKDFKEICANKTNFMLMCTKRDF